MILNCSGDGAIDYDMNSGSEHQKITLKVDTIRESTV